MKFKTPEPIGNLDWGNLVSDILASNDDFESVKNAITGAIKEKLYLAYLWYIKYKDIPKNYLIDHDVSVVFYKSLFDDPATNEPSELYRDHLVRQAFVGGEIQKYESPFSDSYIDPIEEINGKLYIRLKIDPPYNKSLEPELNELGLPAKDYYTTGDLCRLLDLHPDTFRYRLRSGIYPEVKKRDGDKRRFTYDEAKKIIGITKAMAKPENKPRV